MKFLKENSFYQRMIRSMRHRNTIGGWRWPEKNEDAVTRYPNIAAEIDAFSGYLWCPAQHAGVSREIMAAVLEDNEDLSAGEILRLARLFECKFDYLATPTLQLIDPATNKGIRRLWELEGLLRRVGAFAERRRCENTRDMLRSGMPITYAAWRNACRTIENALDIANRPSLRTKRLAAV